MKTSQAESCPGCGLPYPVREGQIIKTIPHVTPMLDRATAKAYMPALYTCRKCGRPVVEGHTPAPQPTVAKPDVSRESSTGSAIVEPATGKRKRGRPRKVRA